MTGDPFEAIAASVTLLVIADDNALNDHLAAMNDDGTEPVVVGFDRAGRPFLAYGWAPGGDGWDTGFVNDDPHSREFDYSDGTGRCDECSAFDRRPTDRLAYPVLLVGPPAPLESVTHGTVTPSSTVGVTPVS